MSSRTTRSSPSPAQPDEIPSMDHILASTPYSALHDEGRIEIPTLGKLRQADKKSKAPSLLPNDFIFSAKAICSGCRANHYKARERHQAETTSDDIEPELDYFPQKFLSLTEYSYKANSYYVVYPFNAIIESLKMRSLRNKYSFKAYLANLGSFHDKSLHGLDNITSEGTEVFDNLADVIKTLTDNGAEGQWGQNAQQYLKESKRYLKTDFKIHVGREENSQYHCTVYSLSDTGSTDYSIPCDHDHTTTCERCNLLETTLQEILTTINSVEMMQDQKARVLFQYTVWGSNNHNIYMM
ncbi:hypothetical protein QZH41_001285 [Actinostola sp. cb2023]|nr:hypothetical protein QZH41_001285 [Actinostola sp. cb2023]